MVGDNGKSPSYQLHSSGRLTDYTLTVPSGMHEW